MDSKLFGLNPNWVDLYSAACAFAFAILAIVFSYYKKSNNPLNASTILLDLLRGASVFPLFLFAITPFFPEMGKAALLGNPLLLSLGAGSGCLAILGDWWKNI